MIASQTRMLWLAKVNETSCASCHQINADQPILQGFALRRVARMLRSQQGANPKGLSDVDTSENWGNYADRNGACWLKYIDTLLFEPPTVDAEKGRNDGGIPSRFFIESLCGLVLRWNAQLNRLRTFNNRIRGNSAFCSAEVQCRQHRQTCATFPHVAINIKTLAFFIQSMHSFNCMGLSSQCAVQIYTLSSTFISTA